MREIVLDTETTGLDAVNGDRIVEIGCVETWNHGATGQVFHAYINPQRVMSVDSVRITGLTDQFLSDKPLFSAIAPEFIAFIADSPLVIHNAAFDMKFLNMELSRSGVGPLAQARVVDTLSIAKKRFPGAQVSLDALCRRFGVDNSGREKHGALLDAELLAEVYLELRGGRQPGLGLTVSAPSAAAAATRDGHAGGRGPRPPRRVLLSSDEAAAHAAFVATLGEDALWPVAASGAQGACAAD